MVPPPEIRDMVEKMGGGASSVLAQTYGITEIAGKSLQSGSPPGNANAKKLMDVAVSAHPTKHENEPTVAASPKNKKKLVAGSHWFGLPAPTTNRCRAFTSSDSGATWSAGFNMPQLTAASSCSDPVVAYAPDGSRVYYSYMDIKSTFDFTGFPAFFTRTEDFDILVSRSVDDGATWTGPVIALNGDPYTITFTPCPSPPFPPGSYCGVLTEPGFAYDKNWVGAHSDRSESAWAYVTATRFNVGSPIPPNSIAFARSGDQGATWSAPLILDSGSAGLPFVLVQGSRPAGGVGGEVLVAWFHSGSDGWLIGSFNIRTARSSDHGASFSTPVNAATDSYELPFWLGPFTFYKRWWGAMFPDVEIGPGGRAHIVYTHDPVAGSLTPEDGDVRYITSAGPPYGSWSSPITVNDDGMARAQGYAALKTQYGSELFDDSTVHVIFEDTRLAPELPTSDPADCFTAPLGPCDSPNLYYDIFYARKPPGQALFFSNFRVSEASSIQDFSFTGDYNDLAANNTLLFAIWTDRRDKTSMFDFEDDVFGSRIIAGGAAP